MQLKTGLLIPPKAVSLRNGEFLCPARLKAACDKERHKTVLTQLKAALRQLHPEVDIFYVTDSRAANLSVFDNSPLPGRNDERYRIEISPDSIQIYGRSPAASYYAIQTLLEMLQTHGGKLPCCTIDDWPDFKRRGVMLDVSRGKVPRLQTLKDLTELLSSWKLNELQLYIENVFKFKLHSEPSASFSPYSAEDILELQRHCELRHIKLVPCLASFGHMEKTLSVKKYMKLAETPDAANYPGGTTLNPDNPDALRLMEDFYEEFLPLFKAEDFNACCDETQLDGKNGVPASLRYAKYVGKLAKLADRHGKRLNIWADCADMTPCPLPQMPKDATFLDYAYIPDRKHTKDCPDRAHRIASEGKRFLLCPGSSSWHTHGTLLDAAVANIAQLAEEGRTLSAEGLLLTDWGDTGHRQPLGCSLHSFAYAAAQAWGGEGVDTESFTKRLCSKLWGEHTGRMAASLEKLGRNSAIAAGGPVLQAGEWRTISKRLYFALIAPFSEGASVLDGLDFRTPLKQIYESHWQTCLTDIPEDACREIIDGAVKFDASPMEGWTSFAIDFIEDLQLAESMDVLAAKRVLFAKGLLRGEGGLGAKAILDESQALHAAFKTNWLKRNRRSRLDDNLSVFRKNISELKGLIHGNREVAS